jgi:predicted transcriptional regulator
MSKTSELAFVLRAKNRVKVLESLKGEQLISKQIEQSTGMYKSHVNRALKELLARGLVICSNPSDRSFKFYKLTQKGSRILNKTKKILN